MNESMCVVWAPTVGLPMKKHSNQIEAVIEAKRLCSLPGNEGKEFIVLRAVQSITYRTEPYVCKQYSKKKEAICADGYL